MDLNKVYYDTNDVPRTVLQMVKYEPEWAANRIQEGEKAIEQLAALTYGTQPTANNTGRTKCLCETCGNGECDGMYNKLNCHVEFTVTKCDGFVKSLRASA